MSDMGSILAEIMEDRIGANNRAILFARARQHALGLECAHEASFARIHLAGKAMERIGPPRQEIIPPSAKMFISFLDEMKAIEEEFMSGKRKRPESQGTFNASTLMVGEGEDYPE